MLWPLSKLSLFPLPCLPLNLQSNALFSLPFTAFSKRPESFPSDWHPSHHFHFTYPIVYLTIGAPRMIGQPLFSILLCFRPFEGLHPTLILSTPLCCLPVSFSVCLSFSLLVQCPVVSSLPVLLILFCAHTISVFVSSQRWEDLHIHAVKVTHSSVYPSQLFLNDQNLSRLTDTLHIHAVSQSVWLTVIVHSQESVTECWWVFR